MVQRLSPVLMVQGTSSSVGKSLLVAGLCRLFRQDGVDVAPFKAQNMALNSYVTPEGHEIGRAQAVQAEAAGLPPHVDMNPILLKPEADARSQVVLMGRPWKRLPAGTYYQHRDELWRYVTAALERLRARHGLVIAEGAGSPAEINLRPGDIVNMEVALHAQAPVLLVGDIDRGGVFAQLIGTLILLQPEERSLVRGLIVNKFRGDLALLQDGLRMLEERAGVPVLGVVPFLHDLGIAEEDGVCLEQPPPPGPRQADQVEVVAIRFPHISNFDDLDALRLEPGVTVRFVTTVGALGRPQAIVLPGSKNTLADLAWLREQGLAQAIVERAREGTAVVGLCGGYQMLGHSLYDPHGADGCPPGSRMPGLGLLPLETVFSAEKHTYQAEGRVRARQGWLAALAGCEVSGYEIHMGETRGGEPLLEMRRRGQEGAAQPDGAVAAEGRVFGTYLHGLFDAPGFRSAWLRSLGWQGPGSGVSLRQAREAAYDRLAAALRTCLDVAALYALVGDAGRLRGASGQAADGG
ncbi:MAG: cobyric acid synthase [Anaerolineae bacterium]|nr:cobyric acid synthase [Anaerolineae bacterium]